jgi:hypothetical protein
VRNFEVVFHRFNLGKNYTYTGMLNSFKGKILMSIMIEVLPTLVLSDIFTAASNKNLILLELYYHIVWSDYRRGFGLDIGFIDHLKVVSSNNYNTIAISKLYKFALSYFQPAIFSLILAW